VDPITYKAVTDAARIAIESDPFVRLRISGIVADGRKFIRGCEV
jgi:hypothetical protein